MKRMIFIMSLIITVICYSRNVIIEGTVLSAEDNLPISEVNVLIRGTAVGNSTDKNGRYQIKSVTLPCEIEFSHLNYFKQNRKLSKNDVKNGKIHLDIYLNGKAQTLDEFVVTGSKLHLIARDIMDYDLQNDNIFVLKNKKEIDLYNLYGYLYSKNRNATNFNILGRDSKNHVCLMNSDSSAYYILNINENTKLNLLYMRYDSVENGIHRIITDPEKYFVPNSKSIDAYHEWIRSITDTLYPPFHMGYVEYYMKYNEVILEKVYDNSAYFSFMCPLCCNERTLFKCYYDSILQDLRYRIVYYHVYDIDDWIMPALQDNLICYGDNLYSLNDFQLLMGQRSEFIQKQIEEKLTNTGKGTGLLNKFNTKPAIFKASGKNIYIFNFYKRIIYHLDEEFHLLSQVTMDENILYTQDIIFNEEGTKCYMIYNRKIAELDLTTGKYKQSGRLIMPMAEKIKIAEDNIYYISTILQNNGIRITNLYRQEI